MSYSYFAFIHIIHTLVLNGAFIVCYALTSPLRYEIRILKKHYLVKLIIAITKTMEIAPFLNAISLKNLMLLLFPNLITSQSCQFHKILNISTPNELGRIESTVTMDLSSQNHTDTNFAHCCYSVIFS